MGTPDDATLVVLVGDGLAGDMDLARWATVGPTYGEAPAAIPAAMVPSLKDLETVHPWGGLSFLAPSAAPLVAANLLAPGNRRPLLAPYRLVDAGGQKVALLGLAQPGAWPGAESTDPQAAIRPLVKTLAREARIMILLSDAGAEADQQLATLDGLDVVIGGGAEGLEQPEAGRAALLVRPGYPGRSVGVLRLTFDGAGRLQRHTWERLFYTVQG